MNMPKRKHYEQMTTAELAAATAIYDQPWTGKGLPGKPLTAAQKTQHRRASAKAERPAKTAILAVIARSLIRRRTAAGLDQKRLATLAGVRAETISRIESGRYRPRRETLLRIDQALASITRTASRQIPTQRHPPLSRPTPLPRKSLHLTPR